LRCSSRTINADKKSAIDMQGHLNSALMCDELFLIRRQ
jgi:hypothetical protein